MTRERRRTRKDNNTDTGNGNLYLLTGLIIGLLLGLVISWVIAPIKFVDTAPNSLRSSLKDEYRLLIATAYHSNDNLPRALARLELLGDPSPILALTTQAQVLLKSGDINGKAFYLAFLIDAIKNASVSQSGTTSSLIELPTDNNTGTIDGAFTKTPLLDSTITPFSHLSDTPSATQIPKIILKSQQNICDSPEEALLLMIDVFDASNQPIPGVEIIISWANGEEHIFTGLQPENGVGYADYLMSPKINYGIRFVSGGVSIANLAAPDCPNSQGATRMGGLKLVFQQP